MTDAHCHVSAANPALREFLSFEPAALPWPPPPDSFVGVHPWTVLAGPGEREKAEAALARFEEALTAFPALGVGEIGLDRLKAREIPPLMQDVFERQLRLAGHYRRPVVLHGAKCWGRVVQAIRALPSAQRAPSFVFHGFSRSEGLIPEIVRLNGLISVGPSVLNDHAVNYRELVKKVPLANLLIETDRSARPEGEGPRIEDVLQAVAALRGLAPGELESIVDANADRVFPPDRRGRIS